MNKIASTQELKGELKSLLAYAQSPNPSRTVLAQQLNALSQRVAGSDIRPSDLRRGLSISQIAHPEYGDWFVVRENPPGTWEVSRSSRPSDTIAVAESELVRFWQKSRNLQASQRVAASKMARMDQADLTQAFDSLKTRQRVEITMKAVMSMSPSETGTPTEYVVGRRTVSRGVQVIHLLNGDGSRPHPMRKITLYKRENSQGEQYVSVATGDMGATLISIRPQ